jgi:phage gp16-like protein
MTSKSPAAKRDTSAIHTMRSKLAQTEDDYRALLHTLVGKRSCSEMTDAQLAVARTHYAKLMARSGLATTPAAGSTRRVVGAKRPVPSEAKLPQVKRIRAMLISLERKPNEYADGILKQMYGAAAPAYYEWASSAQLTALGNALAMQQQREGADTGAGRVVRVAAGAQQA